MPKKQKAVLPAVMTGLAFLAFLTVYWLLTVRSVAPRWGVGLLFLFPAAVLGALTVLTRRGKLSAMAGNVFAVLLTGFFLLTSFVLLVVLSFRGATHPVTDPALYERVLQLTAREHRGLLEAFPPDIPPEAADVTFYYAPQLLQGAGEWELSYAASEAEMTDRAAEWRASARCTAPAEHWPADALLPEGLLPECVRREAGYTVCLLEAEPYQPDSWNHGRLRLAAYREDGRLIWYSSIW